LFIKLEPFDCTVMATVEPAKSNTRWARMVLVLSTSHRGERPVGHLVARALHVPFRRDRWVARAQPGTSPNGLVCPGREPCPRENRPLPANHAHRSTSARNRHLPGPLRNLRPGRGSHHHLLPRAEAHGARSRSWREVPSNRRWLLPWSRYRCPRL